MAKGSGDTRASTWRGNPYSFGGKRQEFHDLPKIRQNAIYAFAKRVAKGMNDRLKNKSVTLSTPDGNIEVGFTQKGCEHFARDAMAMLGGKYFSRRSMNKIDEILAKSTYYNTEPAPDHGKGIISFFHYKDNDGRGVYFGIAHEPNQGRGIRHYLYALTDTMDANKRKKH